MDKKTLKFGSDPEFAAAYRDDNGELFILPPVILRNDFGAPFEDNGRHPIFKRYGDTVVHEDGAAFEMSTPPTSDWRSMWKTLHDTREAFGKDVLEQYSVCDPRLYSLPAMRFQVDRWLGRGEEFKMATLFGCDADEDVFNTRVPCRTMDASKHPWRYMGGHIHASGIRDIEERPLMAVRSMVLTAGLASTAYSDVPELEKERIFLYGKPGKFRIQHYTNGEVGIEYRTPCTRWTESIELAEKIFTWAEIGLTSLLQGGLLDSIAKIVEKEARSAITTVNQKKAIEILDFIATKV